MIMMEIINEFHSQILSPNNRVTELGADQPCPGVEILHEGETVKSALRLNPRSSLIPPGLGAM